MRCCGVTREFSGWKLYASRLGGIRKGMKGRQPSVHVLSVAGSQRTKSRVVGYLVTRLLYKGLPFATPFAEAGRVKRPAGIVPLPTWYSPKRPAGLFSPGAS